MPAAAGFLTRSGRAVAAAARELRDHVSGPAPLPLGGGPREMFLYGLAQPVLGMRVLISDRGLLRAALVPAALLAVFCLVVALADAGLRPWALLHKFYSTFAVLAPMPSIVLGNYYARLACTAHGRLGLGEGAPHIKGLWRGAWESVRMAAGVTVIIAPLLWALERVPGLGRLAVGLLAAGWALFWIVVEALDSARVERPGAAHEEEDQEAGERAWFLVLLGGLARLLGPVRLGWPVRRFARFCRWLCRPWLEEIAVCQAHPALFCGFALSTAALLATPVLDLLFRPIVIIAGVHVLGRLQFARPPAPPL